VVTICTASLTFSNSTLCPHTVFMCFVWISERTAIISLYNINWLVCVTETECVYCAVRTGSLSEGLVTGLSMRRPGFCPRTVHVWFVAKSALVHVSLPVLPFPLSVGSHQMLHTHLHLHVAFTSRTNERSLGTSRKKFCFANRKAFHIQVHSRSLRFKFWTFRLLQASFKAQCVLMCQRGWR
jgi:hypothetical protein